MKPFVLTLAVLFLFCLPLSAQQDMQTVAVVRLTKSEPITVKQLRTEIQRFEQAGRSISRDERREILDVMINERLVLQAAERDKISVTEQEINQQIEQLKAAYGQQLGRVPTNAEFEQEIKKQGVDMAALREQIKRTGILQRYIVAKKGSSFQNLPEPTSSEIVNFYNLNRTKFVRAQTVRVSMITVASGSDRTAAKNLIDRLSREIGSDPAKFDEVSIRAKTPNSGYQAGDGGYIPMDPQLKQTLGDSFINTVFSLKQGQVSKVIETPAGYLIVKVTETYEYKSLGLDDIVLGTDLTVRNYIKAGLTQQKQQEALVKAQGEIVSDLRKGNSFQINEQYLNW